MMKIYDKKLAYPYFVWMTLFTVVPLIIVVYYAFTDANGAFTLDNLTSISGYGSVFARSLLLALIATVICLVIAFPVGYFLSRLRVNKQHIMLMLVMLPMWMNFLLRTYAWMTLLENNGLINRFLGLFGMADPPRREVKGAVERCHQAGIRPVMITGDHKATASAVARELDILRPGDRTLTGAELDFLPQELLEAAQIDGCTNRRFLWSVVLPLSKTILAVMVLLYAIGHWNSYFNAMLYISDKQKWPLQIFLREILIANQIDMTSMTGSSVQEMMRRQELQTLLKYALIVVASVPVLVVYPFVQKHLVKGVMIGSVKG